MTSIGPEYRAPSRTLLRVALPAAVAIPSAAVLVEILIAGYEDQDVIVGVVASALMAATVIWAARILDRADVARKRAERELRKRESDFREMFDSAAVGMVRLRPDGVIQAANAAFGRMLGYEPGELLGETLLAITHPDDQQATLERLDQFRSGARSHVRGLKRYLHRDGRAVWVSFSAAFLYDEDGSPAYVMKVVEDITDRKAAERSLQEAQRMESVGRLAGGIAHDFNSLLLAIGGYGDLALKELDGQAAPDDAVRRYVSQMTAASDRAAALTAQLLAFGRRQVLRPAIVDLNELLDTRKALLQAFVGAQIEVVIDVQPDLDAVRVDPAQIEQVLMSAVMNAREAMTAGGTLTLATSNMLVDADMAAALAMTPGPHVTLSISDSGAGMDSRTLAHALEPFFTTKEQAEGRGLGLSTAHGIVKQSGGEMVIESNPGHGTRLTVFLPRAAARDSAPSDVADSHTVLLVEDDDPARALLREVLERDGFDVLEAEDGLAALEIAQAHRGSIALLVTDVVMPRFDGIEAAARLSVLHPETKVLYISSYLADEERGLRDRLDGPSLEKPFPPERLLDTVHEIFAGDPEPLSGRA